MMTTKLIYGVLAATVLAVAPVAAAPVAAGSRASGDETRVTDARWNAWLGCWRPEAVDGVAPPAHVICVLPGAGDGVSIATIAEGRIISEQQIVADGSRRAVNDGGCSGYESASWSQDGRRVFLKSDLNCGGDVQRKSSGVLALVSTAAYVDVQSVEVAGQHATRTVRYVAMLDAETPSVVSERLKGEMLARESSRIRASSPLDIEDVVEATHAVGSAAAEGLLVARRTGFSLDANRLRALTGAGVQPSTVDVMVALSYPEHFEVAEEVSPAAMRGGSDAWSAGAGVTGSNRASCYSRLGDDRYTYGALNTDAYGRPYSRCGYNSYYSPFGYDSYGWGYGAGPVVVIQPSNGGKPADQVNGVLVKGKGYTRRGASEGTAQPRPQPATRTTTAAGARSTAGTGATPAKGSDTSTSSGASSKGSTGSSSGTDTGRTAKPKGGGL